MRRQNLERKFRWPDLDAARRALLQLGAVCEGTQVQTDTYFRVAAGRLKLRIIEGLPSVLIWYDRPDIAGDRTSSYYLTPVADADLLEATLRAALGLRGVVHKRREVFHHYNIRVHLDEVTGLGAFLELEAVLSESASEEVSRSRLRELIDALGLEKAEPVAGSYADLSGI
jgi:predicted adenylyl cyclase CyaB